jgi:hypothetical protein
LEDNTVTPGEFKSTVKFISLEPDEPLRALVQGYKDRVLRLVGDQLYLADAPHLTVYLAAFPPTVDLVEPLRQLFDGASPPTITIVGWHVFERDQLTGLHTLVCELAEVSKAALRGWQSRIIEALAPLRDGGATESRYTNRWDNLTPMEQDNIRQHGFPYIGGIWQPHLTIASIRPDDWEAVWGALGAMPPRGEFRLPRVQEFELVENRPQARGCLES